MMSETDDEGELAESPPPPPPPSRRGALAKVKAAVRSVNVEPVLFMSAYSLSCYMLIVPVFLYYSRCVELFIDEVGEAAVGDLCANLSANRSAELRVQRDVATLNMFAQLASFAPAVVVALVLGVWSDRGGGRKRPLLLSLLGPAVAIALYLVCSTLYEHGSVYPWVMGAELLSALGGGMTAQFAAAFAIVTDDARRAADGGRSITVRVGLATAAQTVGGLLGALTATTVRRRYSIAAYTFVLVLALVASIATLLYALLYVRESYQPADDKHPRQPAPGAERRGLCERLRDVLPWLQTRLDMVIGVLTVERPGWHRLCLNLTVVCVFAELLSLDNSLLVLFVKSAPLEFSDSLFMAFGTYRHLLHTAGVLVWPPLLVRARLRGVDTLMVCVGVGAVALFYALLSISTNVRMVFFSGSFVFLAAMASPGFRSFLPKLVHQNETARVFTVFALVIRVAPILSALVYNNLYNATVGFWPGFSFVVIALVQLVILGLMIGVHLLMRASGRQTRPADDRANLVDDAEPHDQTAADADHHMPDESTNARQI